MDQIKGYPPMERIICGTLYTRATTPYAYDLRVHDLGHGHFEASAFPRYAWHEVAALEASAQADYDVCVASPPPPTLEEVLARAKLNRERATRRARTMVRRLCKAKALTTLLTLTYRENMADRARMARDFDVFMKRLRRVVPGIEYVCVFERQKRGAWHAHIAVPRVLSHYLVKGHLVRSYDLLRSLWRGVVGVDNGNVDVSRNRRVGRSGAKLASYLSKYIGKEFGAGDRYANSYSASGRELPPAIVERVVTSSQSAAICALVDLMRLDIDGHCEFHQALIDGGGYFLCLSPPAS